MPLPTLIVKDNRTDKTYDLEIDHGTIRAMELREIKSSENDFGLMTYDPGLKNTATARSAITFIDGQRGVLRYRGYAIEELARKSTFLETAFLVLFGELPRKDQLEHWQHEIHRQRTLHESIRRLLESFRYDSDPMGMFVSAVAAMSTLDAKAKEVRDRECRLVQVRRLIAAVPTLAAFAHRHTRGLPFVYPDQKRGYSSNFLNMMFHGTELSYEIHPVLERALETLFILHADHEQNCSTNVMRSIGSSLADPYVALAGAAAALSGPLHGGANQAVLNMLIQIGEKSKVPDFVRRAKDGKQRLMGFGHRVYKNYDPRAKIVKEMVDEVFEVTGRNPLLDVAVELERIALEDEYFVSRKLYPNVDFYSGIIYQAMGIPAAMFPVMFAIARTVGWLAQWMEMLEDEEQKIARPRQIYVGAEERPYVPVERRESPQ